MIEHFEIVDREVGNGGFQGCDYAQQIRILIRTPTSLLFAAHGIYILTDRISYSANVHRKLEWGRIKIDLIEKCRKEIDEFFGIGATDLALRAWREKKTILLGGGGEVHPLPRLVAEKRAAEEYAKIAIAWEADLSHRVARCKQCGAHLKACTVIHRLGDTIQPDHPRTIEEVQRLSNFEVVEIDDYGLEPGKAGFIKEFHTWDGETYWDPHFCQSKCAELYGRRAAEGGLILTEGVEPARKRTTYDVVDHFTSPAPKPGEADHFIHNGERFRL